MPIIDLNVPNAQESTLEFTSISPDSAKFTAHLMSSNFAQLHVTGILTKSPLTTTYNLTWTSGDATSPSWSWTPGSMRELSDFLLALLAVPFPSQPDRLKEIEQIAQKILKDDPQNEEALGILDAVTALRNEKAVVEVPLSSEPSK